MSDSHNGALPPLKSHINTLQGDMSDYRSTYLLDRRPISGRDREGVGPQEPEGASVSPGDSKPHNDRGQTSKVR